MIKKQFTKADFDLMLNAFDEATAEIHRQKL